MKFDADLLIQKRKEIPFKVKTSHINFKEVDEDSRIVKAVVNTFDFFDYDFDVLRKGSAIKSIRERGAKSQAPNKIQHLLMHDMHRPVGKSQLESEEEVDGKSVLYTESFLPDTVDGDDTLIKYDAGIYNQHSIGFNYLQITHVEKGASGWDNFLKGLINPEDAEEVGYGYDVTEIKWHEYSTVTFGANKLTPYLGTKNAKKSDLVGIINQKLTILANKAMRREVKNKEAFDFEVAQLQQMILELSEIGPSAKDTLLREPSEKDNQKKIKLIGFSNNLKF